MAICYDCITKSDKCLPWVGNLCKGSQRPGDLCLAMQDCLRSWGPCKVCCLATFVRLMQDNNLFAYDLAWFPVVLQGIPESLGILQGYHVLVRYAKELAMHQQDDMYRLLDLEPPPVGKGFWVLPTLHSLFPFSTLPSMLLDTHSADGTRWATSGDGYMSCTHS